MRACPLCADEHLSYLRERDQLGARHRSAGPQASPSPRNVPGASAGPPSTSGVVAAQGPRPAATSEPVVTATAPAVATIGGLAVGAGLVPGATRRRSRWDQAEPATVPQPRPPPAAFLADATSGGTLWPMTVLEYFASVSHLPPDLQAVLLRAFMAQGQ